MPKEIFETTVERASGENWGLVVSGGKDMVQSIKLSKIRVFSNAERAGLKERDFLISINGKEVFDMDHEDVCRMIAKAGTKMELIVERGDHIVPSFEEIWPSRRPVKRVKRGIEYYLDAMEDNGLKGNLKQPDNFTTCGKLNLEIKQYNNPKECYDEKTIEDMTDEMEMMTNPNLVEKRKEMKEQKTGGPTHGYDPAKSQVIPVLEEHNQLAVVPTTSEYDAIATIRL